VNPERANDAIARTLREYVKSRSTYRKEKDGSVYSSGMTIVSPDDKRIDEIARLATESLLRLDDQRTRISVETRKLQLGDVFTRYTIKDGVGVDEEVTVVKVNTNASKTTIKYRRQNDTMAEVTIDSTYLVSIYRPST
jgi:hypothetical protein